MDGQFLPPRILQAFGLLLIVGAAVFWALTGQQSALLVGAGIALCTLGAYSGLHVSIKQDLVPKDNQDDPP